MTTNRCSRHILALLMLAALGMVLLAGCATSAGSGDSEEEYAALYSDSELAFATALTDVNNARSVWQADLADFNSATGAKPSTEQLTIRAQAAEKKMSGAVSTLKATSQKLQAANPPEASVTDHKKLVGMIEAFTESISITITFPTRTVEMIDSSDAEARESMAAALAADEKRAAAAVEEFRSSPTTP